MTYDGMFKYPLERYGNDAVPLSGVLKDICLKAGMAPHERHFKRRQPVPARICRQPPHGCTGGFGAASGVVLYRCRGNGRHPAFRTARRRIRGHHRQRRLGGRAIAGRTNKYVFRKPVCRMWNCRNASTSCMSIRRATTSRTPSTLPASTDAIITREKQTREISISLTPDEAKQIAERTLYNAWVERNQYKFSLPPKWLRLDPADVVTVNIDDLSLKLRLNKVDFGGNNVVSCEAVAEDEIVYISNSTGSGGGLPSTDWQLAGPTPLFLMDLPMLRYEDDTLGMYYAFGFRDNTVTGASMYRSPDELAWEVLGTGNDGPDFRLVGHCACPMLQARGHGMKRTRFKLR
jgi:hypothetical protein